MANTARYRFEYRLFDWAEGLSRSLCGSRHSFFIGFRKDGSIRRVYFAPADQAFDGARKDALAQAHTSWVLYAPHTERGTGYLEWLNLRQEMAEMWLRSPLNASDFQDVRSDTPRKGWPQAWRVLVN